MRKNAIKPAMRIMPFKGVESRGRFMLQESCKLLLNLKVSIKDFDKISISGKLMR